MLQYFNAVMRFKGVVLEDFDCIIILNWTVHNRNISDLLYGTFRSVPNSYVRALLLQTYISRQNIWWQSDNRSMNIRVDEVDLCQTIDITPTWWRTNTSLNSMFNFDTVVHHNGIRDSKQNTCRSTCCCQLCVENESPHYRSYFDVFNFGQI